MNHLSISGLDALPQVARQFLEIIGPTPRVIAFVAPMGTGKTTFIKAFAEQLGSMDITNSPTFAIVNEYEISSSEGTIFHMDCYRLNHLDEAIELGFEDYFRQDAWCLVEWPEVIEPILPKSTLWVTISALPDGTREIMF